MQYRHWWSFNVDSRGAVPPSGTNQSKNYRALALAAVATTVALLWASEAAAQTYDVTIPLPASVDFHDVVLGATSNVRVEAFSNVEGGSHSRIINMGALNTGVSFGASTGDIFSVATTTIEIGRVTGNITCEGLIVNAPGSVVTGTLKQLTSIGRSSGPVLHAQFPATSSGSVNVLPLQTQTLAPGRYTTLNVSPGGTLSLRSGIYYLHLLLRFVHCRPAVHRDR